MTTGCRAPVADGKLLGAPVKCLIRQDGKSEGFLGFCRHSKAVRMDDFDARHGSGQLRHHQRIFRAAPRNDQLIHFDFGQNQAAERVGNGKRSEHGCGAHQIGRARRDACVPR